MRCHPTTLAERMTRTALRVTAVRYRVCAVGIDRRGRIIAIATNAPRLPMRGWHAEERRWATVADRSVRGLRKAGSEARCANRAACRDDIRGTGAQRVKDFNLTLSVRNNRILRKVHAAGFKSLLSFCRAKGINYAALSGLVNLRVSPFLLEYKRIRMSGEGANEGQTQWKPFVLRLARTLECEPEDLFSTALLAEREANKVSLELDAAEVVALAGSITDVARQLAETPESILSRRELTEILDASLANLTPKEEMVIRRLYGLTPDEEPSTLAEIGTVLGRSRERVRQIESKALRKLRKVKDLRTAAGD